MTKKPSKMLPELLCAELWDAHYGPEWPVEKVNELWARDLALSKLYCTHIFGDDLDTACRALILFLNGVTRGKGRLSFGSDVNIPPGWFHTFYGYHCEGRIGPQVWGWAARNLYSTHGRGSASFLPGLRAAHPEHLMRPEDYQLWARLQATVTLYRGVSASTLDTAWHGVSWTMDPDYAGAYANVRTLKRYDAGDTTCWPRLIEARVPRAAVLGIIQQGSEYLVDYQAMHVSMIREVAPIPPGEVPAHIEMLVAKAAATRADRAVSIDA